MLALKNLANLQRTKVCPICHNNFSPEKKETFSKWSLYECRCCDVQFWSPLEHPGKQFYENEYDMVGAHGSQALSWGSREFLKDPSVKSGNLLDIGCSSGEFLIAAQQRGFAVWGIDISDRAVAAARVLYGLQNVYAEVLRTFSQRATLPRFDVVTFFEVIEHVDDPLTFISDARRLLKPGGYLVFSTPDRDCIGGWHDTPPQHLFRWNERSLRHFLHSQNFEVINVIREPISHRYFLYRFFGSDSALSLGIVSWVKKRIKIKLAASNVERDAAILKNKPLSLKLAEKGAMAKVKLFKFLIFPVVAMARLLGLKWQSIYIVAKLRGELSL